MITNWKALKGFVEISCGLMKKWNDYQRRGFFIWCHLCCGLMKKWNDYQHFGCKHRHQQVVVWWKNGMITNYSTISNYTPSVVVWWKNGMITNATQLINHTYRLWFDEKMEWLPTSVFSQGLSGSCGLMKKWNDYQQHISGMIPGKSCGLMKKWNDYQLIRFIPINTISCGLMKKWNDYQRTY